MSKLNLIVSRLPHMRFQLYMAPVEIHRLANFGLDAVLWNHMPLMA